MKSLAALTFFLAGTAAADPWVDPRAGHGAFFLGFSDTRADEYFAAGIPPVGGQFPSVPQLRGHRYANYVPVNNGMQFGTPSYRSTYSTQTFLMTGDVSLGRGFAFAFAAPMLKNVAEHAEGFGSVSYLGWGDLVLGARYEVPLPKRARAFSFGPQLWLTTPTGDAEARKAPPRSVIPLPLQTGAGTVDLEARLSAGYRFDPVPVWVVAEVGYHHHLNEQSVAPLTGSARVHTRYADDLPYLVRIGGTWAAHRRGLHHGTLALDLSGARTFGNGDKTTIDNPLLTYAGQFNNASWFSMGGSVSWFPVRWVGIHYAVAHVLAGGGYGNFLTNTVGVVSEF